MKTTAAVDRRALGIALARVLVADLRREDVKTAAPVKTAPPAKELVLVKR